MGDYKKSESNAKTGVEIHQRCMLATAMLFRGAIRVALDRARSRSAGNACAVLACSALLTLPPGQLVDPTLPPPGLEASGLSCAARHRSSSLLPPKT